MDIFVFAIIVYQVRNTKCTRTKCRNYFCLSIILDRELQGNKTNVLIISTIKIHNNHIEHDGSHRYRLVVPHKIFTIQFIRKRKQKKTKLFFRLAQNPNI